MNEEYVSTDLFEGRRAVVDERFSRDIERIERAEENISEIRQLTIVTNQLVRRHENRLSEHEARINTLERRPASKAEKIEMIILTAIISAIVTAVASGMLSKFADRRTRLLSRWLPGATGLSSRTISPSTWFGITRPPKRFNLKRRLPLLSPSRS